MPTLKPRPSRQLSEVMATMASATGAMATTVVSTVARCMRRCAAIEVEFEFKVEVEVEVEDISSCPAGRSHVVSCPFILPDPSTPQK
ncbi:hypothetical protein GCM10009672_20970 [Nesterenkonia lutea]